MSNSVETVYTCDACGTMSDVELGEDAAHNFIPEYWTQHRVNNSFSNMDLCGPCSLAFRTMIDNATAVFFNATGADK